MADDTPHEPASKDPEKKDSPLMGVLSFILALGLGFGAVRLFRNDASSAPVLDDDTRYSVGLRGDEPTLGPADAPVTIVEFADYQCPYCARAREPLEQAMDAFEGDVRLIYKHFPLPGHGLALPAAKAAWAAHQQGKFWPMHAELFESGSSVKEIGARATAMGMDPQQFLRDFGSPHAAKAVDDDMLAGAKLGVTGTPVFYVNGHRYVGFRDQGQWTEVLEYELELAEQVMEGGVERADVYAAMMDGAIEQRRSRDPNPPSPKPSPGGLDPDVTYPVDVEGRPALGPDDALVTVAVFSDFQCPYCSRIAPTLHELVEAEDDVRVVSMQLPIPSHPRARDAAKAALAAQRQDKFWPMHDALFEHSGALSGAELSAYAEELGLDVAQFEDDLADPAIEARIEADVAMARELGVRSTPATFVNGHYVRGAVPLSTLREAVAEHRPMAQAMVDAGTPRAGVYAALMAEAVAD